MLRILLLTIGILAIFLGILGIFLPILPTTPFILLAAACFARSSEKFHQWLLNNKYFGPTIANWEQNKAISLKTKILAITFLNISMAVSLFLVKPNVHLLIILLIVDISVTLFLLSIPLSPSPSKKKD